MKASLQQMDKGASHHFLPTINKDNNNKKSYWAWDLQKCFSNCSVLSEEAAAVITAVIARATGAAAAKPPGQIIITREATWLKNSWDLPWRVQLALLRLCWGQDGPESPTLEPRATSEWQHSYVRHYSDYYYSYYSVCGECAVIEWKMDSTPQRRLGSNCHTLQDFAASICIIVLSHERTFKLVSI